MFKREINRRGEVTRHTWPDLGEEEGKNAGQILATGEKKKYIGL